MTSVSNLLILPIKLSSHPDSPSFYDTLYPILDKLPIDLKPSSTDLTYELRELDRLRLKFITGIHSKSSEGRIHLNVLEDCLEYYKQLSCSITKLPIFEIDFSWGNAFLPSEAKVNIPNLYYEKMNVLFNMGIIYLQLGCFQNRTNDQGLKLAGHYFQLSAGIFDQLRNTIENRPNLSSNIPEPEDLTIDFSHYSLDFLINLNLAQAQECFWQKAVLDQMKNATIAKLAKQVSDYYDRAFTSASHKSVSILFNESIVNHLQLKKLHFEAAAEFRMSIDCLGTNQYGMEIARLKIGQDLVRAANKLGGPFASPAALDDLQSLQQVIEHNLSRAEKDNSIIYLDVMPKIVPKINLAPMVKPHISKEVENPKDVLNKENKPILLQSLPPYSLIQAISIYEERRDQLVNRELIQKLNAIDKIYQTTINGEGGHAELPNATQNAQLPNEVLMMMDEIMDLGGLQELRDKVKTIIDLSTQNSGILKQNFDNLTNIQKILDERYDEYLGAWDYEDSPEELVVKNEKISQAFSASQESDQKLIQKVNTNERIFTILNSPSNEVKSYIFTASPTTSKHHKINLNEQDIMHYQQEFHKRQQLKMEMEQVRQSDNIQPILRERFQSLIDNHPNMDPDLIELAQFEPLFQNQLRKYDTYQNMVNDEESLMQQFLSQNNIQSPMGSPISKSVGNVELKVEELKSGVEEFKWCLQNLEQGENFHKQLNSILCGHQDKINEFFTNMESDFKEFCQMNPTLMGDEDDDDVSSYHNQLYHQSQYQQHEPTSKSPQQPQPKFTKDESFSYGNHTDFGMDFDMTPQNPLNTPYIKNLPSNNSSRGNDGLPENPLNTPYTKK